MRASLHAAAVLLAVTAASCSHAPAIPAGGQPAPTWPHPPAAPRVAWVRSLPDTERPDQRSGVRRFFDALLGVEPGAGEPLLVRPFGLAARPGELLIADPDGPAVIRVDLGSASFSPIRCQDGDWGAPMAVLPGPADVLFVADAGLGLVIKVSDGGRHCDRWGLGELERPTSLALLGDRLYVADPPAHAVLVFDLGGATVGRFGTPGEGDEGFNFPTSLAAAPDGSLLLVDALNFKVKRLAPDGTLRSSFGEAGDDAGRFSRPKALAVDGHGNIFVTDTQRGQVLAFTPEGRFLYAIGEEGEGPGQLTLPAGVAVEGDLLFVADGQHRRIETYRFLGDRS